MAGKISLLCSLVVVFLCVVFAPFSSLADDDSNKLYILIDNANLFACSGPANQFTLTKNDVSVTDKDGKAVKILVAPGEYFIRFDNIKVLRQMPNISGRLACTLQVPLLSSNIVRLDFPYQIIPQNTLVEGYKCDNESGDFFDTNDKRHYCRYCALCDTSTHVENKISSTDLGFKYSPNLKTEGSFEKVCRAIDSQTYSLKRSVILPDKKELENQANERYKSSLEGPVLQKLKVGSGKLQVFLNLDSNTDSPVDANQWYSNNQSCSCCVKDQAGNSNCQRSAIEYLLGRKSQRCLSCNNEYVKNCLRGSSQRVGCYVVEFNFKVTDKAEDYETFKKQVGQDSGNSVVAGGASSPSSSGQGQSGANVPPQKASSSTSGQGQSSSSVGGALPCDSCDDQACVADIAKSRPDFARYCKDFRQRAQNVRTFCCQRCPNICSSVPAPSRLQ